MTPKQAARTAKQAVVAAKVEAVLGIARYLNARDGEINVDQIAHLVGMTAENVTRLVEDEAGSLVGIHFLGDTVTLRFKVQ